MSNFLTNLAVRSMASATAAVRPRLRSRFEAGADIVPAESSTPSVAVLADRQPGDPPDAPPNRPDRSGPAPAVNPMHRADQPIPASQAHASAPVEHNDDDSFRPPDSSADRPDFSADRPDLSADRPGSSADRPVSSGANPDPDRTAPKARRIGSRRPGEPAHAGQRSIGGPEPTLPGPDPATRSSMAPARPRPIDHRESGAPDPGPPRVGTGSAPQRAAGRVTPVAAHRPPPLATAPTAATPAVVVTIGRVEVRAVVDRPSAPTARPAPVKPPVQSLEDYLGERSRGPG